MLATHLRNLDPDCSHITVLQHAPKTTDSIESGFAHVDRAQKLETGIGATLGIAHGKLMHFTSSSGRKEQEARRSCSHIPVGPERDAAIASKIRKWDITSFFSLSRAKRWQLLCDVQARFTELCVDRPQAQLRKHDEDKLEMKNAARQKELDLAAKRFTQAAEMDTIVPIVDIAALRALKVPRII